MNHLQPQCVITNKSCFLWLTTMTDISFIKRSWYCITESVSSIDIMSHTMRQHNKVFICSFTAIMMRSKVTKMYSIYIICACQQVICDSAVSLIQSFSFFYISHYLPLSTSVSDFLCFLIQLLTQEEACYFQSIMGIFHRHTERWHWIMLFGELLHFLFAPVKVEEYIQKGMWQLNSPSM